MNTDLENHYRKLENMYHKNAPINKYFKPQLTISKGYAELLIPVREDFFHAGGSLHGSVYFKAADDAAYFAAQSFVQDYFIFTTNFTINIIRPVTSGVLKAIGTILQRGRNLMIAEAELFNDAGKLVAKGSGNFMKSPEKLREDIGYTL
ncbi:MAG: PaaI family thioesterase [Spirochaetota bacterium]